MATTAGRQHGVVTRSAVARDAGLSDDAVMRRVPRRAACTDSTEASMPSDTSHQAASDDGWRPYWLCSGTPEGREPTRSAQSSQCRRALGPAATRRRPSRCFPARQKRATGASGDPDSPPEPPGADSELTRRRGIPVTAPARTLADLRARVPGRELRQRDPTGRRSRGLPTGSGRRSRSDAQRARAPVPMALPSSSAADTSRQHASCGAYGRLLLGGGEAHRRDGRLPIPPRSRRVRGRSGARPEAAWAGL